jgi:hypothetical protein
VCTLWIIPIANIHSTAGIGVPHTWENDMPQASEVNRGHSYVISCTHVSMRGCARGRERCAVTGKPTEAHPHQPYTNPSSTSVCRAMRLQCECLRGHVPQPQGWSCPFCLLTQDTSCKSASSMCGGQSPSDGHDQRPELANTHPAR